MKIFKSTSNNNPVTKDEPSNVKHQAYGSVMGEIGQGDLTKPYINTQIQSESNFISFGRDNKFPQLIDQMYYQSPLHSSIIDFQINATIGGGFYIESSKVKSPEEKVDELTFLRRIKAPKMVRSIAMDLKMHRRFHLKVTKRGADVIKVERVMPSKVRYNSSATKFWISDDWSTSRSSKIYNEYDFAPVQDGVTVEQIYSYIDLESCPGQDVYPLDRTVASFNWCYLDGQSANLQKANIQKSIFGNIVIKRPSEFKSNEEFDLFKRGVENKQGDIVPVLLLSADGKENLPDVESFPANQNDKAFENMDKRIDDKICQAHTINPIIMGISRPGSLGSGSEIEEAYPIWEKNVVLPFRTQIEEVMCDIMFLFKVNGDFKFNVYSIIDIENGETKDGKFSSDEPTSDNPKQNLNLMGLSAAQNSDIYRIIRDYNRGKLPLAIAEVRLAAYGLAPEDINNILKLEE